MVFLALVLTTRLLSAEPCCLFGEGVCGWCAFVRVCAINSCLGLLSTTPGYPVIQEGHSPGAGDPWRRMGISALIAPWRGKPPCLCAVFWSASVSGPSGALELNVKPPRTRAWSMFGKVAGQVWALGRLVLQPHEWKQRLRESGLPAGECWFYWRHWARPAALLAPSASRLLLGLSCLAQGV